MFASASYQRQIEEAARVLSHGGVVAFPTDTVYGLGADIHNRSAVDRVYEIKGRPKEAPLPVLIADISRITDVVDHPEPLALRLAELAWPGGITLVLPTTLPLAAAVLQDGYVGVRVPDDPFCLRLINAFGGPITGTSANLSGHPPAVNAKQVRKQLGNAVDYVLDIGEAQQKKPSTVVRITGQTIEVLREGVVSEAAIMETWRDFGAESHAT